MTQLETKLDERFPPETMDCLKALDKILNPKRFPVAANEIRNYGTEELDYLIEHYSAGDVQPPLLNVQRCRQDFVPYKHHTHLSRESTFVQHCEDLILNHMDNYPDFVTLANIALVIPLNSASCERGFFPQNLNKTKS